MLLLILLILKPVHKISCIKLDQCAPPKDLLSPSLNKVTVCNPLSLWTPRSRIRLRETSSNLDKVVSLRAATPSSLRRIRPSATTPTSPQTSDRSKKKIKSKTLRRTTHKMTRESKWTGCSKLMNILSILRCFRAKKRTITSTCKYRLWDKISRRLEMSNLETNMKSKPVKTWQKRISIVRHPNH